MNYNITCENIESALIISSRTIAADSNRRDIVK